MSKTKKLNEVDAVQAYINVFYLMNDEQKRRVRNEIEKAFTCTELGATSFDDLITPSDSETLVACPCSVGHTIAKNGKDRNGKQRYICKDCGKSFFAANHSLSSNTNQDISVWARFILGMLKHYTLSDLSEECNISRTTALHWRLRVFQALEHLLSQIKLNGVIAADDTRVDYNLKGRHGEGFVMPRNSRKRGGDNNIQNHNKNSLCVLCAVDENGNSFSKIVGFGNPSAIRICEGFKGKIDINSNGNILVTDGAKCFKQTVETYNFRDWKRKKTVFKGTKRVPDTKDSYHIQQINSYHSRLKRFLRNYNGISSRYLPGYLLLFDYLQNNKNTDHILLCKEVLSTMASLPALTVEDLENRYLIPASNTPTEKTWERRVPPSEQRIYKDWVEQVPIKEIIKKYKINRRRIYTIKEKVEKYNLHDAIVNKEVIRTVSARNPRPISPRSWDIFLKVYSQGIDAKAVAREYGISFQAVYKTVKIVKARRESQTVKKYTPPCRKSQRLNKVDTTSRDEAIYAEYKLLKPTAKSKEEIYKTLSNKHPVSSRKIKEIVYCFRCKDKTPDFIRRNSTLGCSNLEKHYANQQSRNRLLLQEINDYRKNHPNTSIKDTLNLFAGKYKLSFWYVVKMFYNQEKYLHIHDTYLQKHSLMQLEEEPERQL